MKFKLTASIAFREKNNALHKQTTNYIALKVIAHTLCVSLTSNAEKNYAAI